MSDPSRTPASGPASAAGAEPANGVGLAAGVTGALAPWFALLWAPVGIVVAAVALGLGVVGLKRVQRGEATNRGAALWGVVLGGASLVVALVLVVLGVGLLLGTDQ